MNNENLIAERLDELFKTVLHPEAREYTYKEVEEGTETLGYRVSATYIWKLRRGEQSKPNWLVLRVLAQFFKVSITFFYDEEKAENKNSPVQDSKIQEIALRASQLGDAARQAVLEVIKQIAKVEGKQNE